MKKEYVSPRVDIIYTKMEDALLKVSEGTGPLPGGTGAKAFNGDFEDFTDEPLWKDENSWK